MQRRTCLTARLNCKKVIGTQRICGDNYPNRATRFLLPLVAFTARDLTTRIHYYPPLEPAQATRAMRLTWCPSVLRPTHRSPSFASLALAQATRAMLRCGWRSRAWCGALCWLRRRCRGCPGQRQARRAQQQCRLLPAAVAIAERRSGCRRWQRRGWRGPLQTCGSSRQARIRYACLFGLLALS